MKLKARSDRNGRINLQISNLSFVFHWTWQETFYGQSMDTFEYRKIMSVIDPSLYFFLFWIEIFFFTFIGHWHACCLATCWSLKCYLATCWSLTCCLATCWSLKCYLATCWSLTCCLVTCSPFISNKYITKSLNIQLVSFDKKYWRQLSLSRNNYLSPQLIKRSLESSFHWKQ